VFGSPVLRLEKRPELDQTGLQSWSFIFKNQRLKKDRSVETGPNRFRLVFSTHYLPLQKELKTMQNDRKLTEIFKISSRMGRNG